MAVQDDDDDNHEQEQQDRWKPLSLTAKILFPLQLAAAIGVLLLLPATMAVILVMASHNGSDITTTTTTTTSLVHALTMALAILGPLPYEYMEFFGVLLIPRVFQYGTFATTTTTTSTTTISSSSSLDGIVFGLTLIASHWSAVYRYTLSQLTTTSITTNVEMLVHNINDANDYSSALTIVRTATIGWVGWSSLVLGKSYDRLTRPAELVQSGPYAVVRHPIYTAYLMLFTTTLGGLLHNGTTCAIFAVVAIVFYVRRMDTEEAILAESFGVEYEQYRQNVPWRLVPFVY